MKITVDVAVGEGVSVFRVGVIEGVSVDEGWAATVWVAAALAVRAIKVLTAFGSAVGKGAANVGTQAITSASAMIAYRNLSLRVDMFPLHTRMGIGDRIVRYLSTWMAV